MYFVVCFFNHFPVSVFFSQLFSILLLLVLSIGNLINKCGRQKISSSSSQIIK